MMAIPLFLINSLLVPEEWQHNLCFAAIAGTMMGFTFRKAEFRWFGKKTKDEEH
jgi:hypothetical protein